MGTCAAPDRGSVLTVYVLDSTVLIGYLRDTPSIASTLRQRLGEGHTLATTCVNLAEVERGLHSKERRRAMAFLDRLRFLVTDREAARRAGQYQSEWARRGRTIHTPERSSPERRDPTAPCFSLTILTTSRCEIFGLSSL